MKQQEIKFIWDMKSNDFHGEQFGVLVPEKGLVVCQVYRTKEDVKPGYREGKAPSIMELQIPEQMTRPEIQATVLGILRELGAISPLN